MSSRGDDSDTHGDFQQQSADLYSLLKLDRDATSDDIHRSYRALSTTFHPDKLPPQQQQSVQEIFLEVKKAHDVLIDPVLRLTYDHYGDDGVTLLKRLQMEQREHQARKEAAAEMDNERYDDDDDEQEEEEEDDYNLYERLEKLLQSHAYLQARQELQEFMVQHDYHQNLSEENQVHLNLSMRFPSTMDLKKTLYSGKQYLKYAQKRVQDIAISNEEEREFYRQRILQERHLIDYQFNKFKDSQKAEVGFTLSSTQPRNITRSMKGRSLIPPKWSMAMGASTTLIYPEVASVMAMVGQKDRKENHPVSIFINTAYQPIPQTQINLTSNLSNDDSHQFIISSAHTFANQTACRCNMTFLTKSPLATPLILNFKTYRHLKNIGMATGAVSLGGNCEMLQWNAKWEAHKDNHKVSASASMGILQGNSLEVSYRTHFRKSHWLEEYITIPKQFEVTSIWGQVQKVKAMITQELTSFANHPTLGFGMEHDVSLGRWTWIWELQYNDSSFKIPIPVVHLGSVSNPSGFYSRKLYFAFYCLLFQSIMADFLQDPDTETSRRKEKAERDAMYCQKAGTSPPSKTKEQAERQLKLMVHTAEKKRFLESQRRNGLVILQATYWYQTREANGNASGIVTMDATQQLQFWVSNGRLKASAIPKSSWLGFYDLQADDFSVKNSGWDWRVWRRWRRNRSRNNTVDMSAPEPQLTIRYANSGNVFEITVGETEPFVLPCNDVAECLGNANFVE
ncbi:chaperone protein DnaJ [Nitzschia inconspicua]|uniref:Chaperone protein DnaJ n=1 Tax=Nitzschia inconspicua TaxID=303405 RepID=A0A9K3L3K4_9STRA|nr:chaperone protein DnaJ [Nitzschia inconspicua]